MMEENKIHSIEITQPEGHGNRIAEIEFNDFQAAKEATKSAIDYEFDVTFGNQQAWEDASEARLKVEAWEERDNGFLRFEKWLSTVLAAILLLFAFWFIFLG